MSKPARPRGTPPGIRPPWFNHPTLGPGSRRPRGRVCQVRRRWRALSTVDPQLRQRVLSGSDWAVFPRFSLHRRRITARFFRPAVRGRLFSEVFRMFGPRAETASAPARMPGGRAR